MSEEMHSRVKEYLTKLVKSGHTEAKLKYLPHATFFKRLVETHHHIPAKIEKKLGHASTYDAKPGEILKEHFHVFGVKSTAYRVLGKFV